jgi:flagellar hook-length control protein FliK
MPAAAVAKLTSKVPVGTGADANVAAATDGVDFAALLAAQFQGMDGVPAIGVEAGAGAPVQADGAAQDIKAEIAPDAQAMALMPGVAPLVQALQQAAPETRPALSALSPDKSPGDRKVPTLPGLAEAGLAQAKEGAAEFAVNGKSLPSGESKVADVKVADVKAADAFKLPALPVDVQRTPDVISAVPEIMSANQPRAAGEVKTPVAGVQPPVGDSGWGEALGQKLVWMTGQHQQVAELHLNPPHLGPMEVRLTINNDQVSALFVSHQPAVREAIEAAMPRLREMFADSGMTLGNAMVSSDSLPQHQGSAREKQSGAESRPDFPLADGYSMPLTSRGIMTLPGDGCSMVDLFA